MLAIIKNLGKIYNDSADQISLLTDNQIKNIREVITDKFLDLPCNVSFEYGNAELDSFEYVKKTYYQNNVLLISADNINSELLQNSLNLWFRAWHDYIHISNNYLFGFEGEFYAFLKHCEGQSEIFKKVLFSEVVLQTAYYETYGMFAPEQKLVLLDNVEELIEEIKVGLKTQTRFGGMRNVGINKPRIYA